MYKFLLLLLSFNYLIINGLNFQSINDRLIFSNKQIKSTSKVNNLNFFKNVNTLVISGGAIYGLSYVSLLEKINEENSNIIIKIIFLRMRPLKNNQILKPICHLMLYINNEDHQGCSYSRRRCYL